MSSNFRQSRSGYLLAGVQIKGNIAQLRGIAAPRALPAAQPLQSWAALGQVFGKAQVAKAAVTIMGKQ